MLETAALTASTGGLGCAKLVCFCNVVEDNPFVAGAHIGVGEAETVLNVGVSGPGVVRSALERLGPELWPVVEQLPSIGRPLYASHLSMTRPTDPVLSGWHAINCIREWRGDTHWAIVVAAGLSSPEASILHNAWLGYEADWLARSRGASEAEIDAGWAGLEAKGLAVDRNVTADGIALRQRIEDDTDRLTTLPWELLGEERSRWFAEAFEPPCVRLLERVDITAGPNSQPASRLR